jgi:hypothetical protein
MKHASFTEGQHPVGGDEKIQSAVQLCIDLFRRATGFNEGTADR